MYFSLHGRSEMILYLGSFFFYTCVAHKFRFTYVGKAVIFIHYRKQFFGIFFSELSAEPGV